MSRQSQPWPQSKVQTSLSYVRPCLKQSEGNAMPATLEGAICSHHDSVGKRFSILDTWPSLCVVCTALLQCAPTGHLYGSS